MAGASLLAALVFLSAPSAAAAAGCPNEVIRQQQNSTYLPDCMAFEQVSPPVKGNRAANSPSFSADGERVIFSSNAALAETPGMLNPFGDDYVASRTASGWVSSPTSPPGAFGFGWGRIGGTGTPQMFTPDLGRWISVQATQPEAQNGWLTLFEANLAGAWTPRSQLLQPLDGHHSTSLYLSSGTGFTAATPDLSHLYFTPSDNASRSAAYLPGDPQPGPGSITAWNTYVFAKGPEGAPTIALLARDSVGKAWGGSCGSWVGGGNNIQAWAGRNQGAVSPDGSVVYFSTRPAQAEGAPCPSVGTANLLLSSSDETEISGTVQPFSIGQEITGAGIASNTTVTAVSGQKISLSKKPTAPFGFNVALTGVNPIRILRRSEAAGQVAISEIAPGGPAAGNDFFEGASSDGSRVYFTTARSLASTDHDPVSEECESSEPAVGHPLEVTLKPSKGCDLYLYERTPSGGQEVIQASAGEAVLATGSAVTVEGSNTLSGVSNEGDQPFAAGQAISGEGIPVGTTIANVTSATELELSAPATQSFPGGTRISATVHAVGEGADVYQGVTAISGDGSHVYFAAHGVLTAHPNPEGEVAKAGALNLYVYERDGSYPAGHLGFIGGLDAACTPAAPSADVTAVSPDCRMLIGYPYSYWDDASAVPMLGGGGPGDPDGDGHILVFETTAPLTADDQDGLHADVYRYDSTQESLICVSCAPARPGGPFDVAGRAETLKNPGPEAAEHQRWVSEDGNSIVFTTGEALAANDADGQVSPYLWRASAGGGELTWLPGSGDRPTVSHDGSEVAFGSTNRLLPSDGDTAEDVYLARADGGYMSPPAEEGCVSEGCQGPASQAPAALPAGSNTFVGPGNPGHRHHKAKHRHRRHRHRHHGRHHHRRKGHPSPRKHARRNTPPRHHRHSVADGEDGADRARVAR